MIARRTRLLAIATSLAFLAACSGSPTDEAELTPPVAGISEDADATPPVPSDVADDLADASADAGEPVPESPPEGQLSDGEGEAAYVDQGAVGVSVAALTVPQCLTTTSGARYVGSSIGVQTAPFVITWDVTPLAAGIDAAVSVSKGLATSGWENLAAIIRFNTAGRIDARNGSTYAAAVSVPYVAGSTYRIRATVDPTTRKYTVGVTPPGSTEKVLAKDYAFRTQQATITQVDNWVAASFSGSLKACLLDVTAAAAPAPTPVTEPAPAPAPTTDTTAPPKPLIPTTPVDSSLRTVAQWEQLFLGRWDAEHTGDYLPRSTSKNSWRYYNLGYGIDANTAMYEATGNTRYLDRALLYVENVINDAVRSSSLSGSQFKDSYLGWGAWDHPTDPNINGGEYPLYESYCFRYAMKMLRAMRDDPNVYGNTTYRAKYDRILAFTKQNIFNKWMSRGANSHVYRNRTHMASHWAFIALDLWALTPDATERARYKTVVDNINLHLPNYSSSLRQQLKTHMSSSTAYFWSHQWAVYSTPGQDVSHGNNMIAYLVEANRLGVEWTRTDMLKFASTLKNVVWKSGGGYANNVDGSGTGNGWINDGFVKLGRYDVAVQKRLESYTVGRGIQLYGNGALNALLLNGR